MHLHWSGIAYCALWPHSRLRFQMSGDKTHINFGKFRSLASLVMSLQHMQRTRYQSLRIAPATRNFLNTSLQPHLVTFEKDRQRKQDHHDDTWKTLEPPAMEGRSGPDALNYLRGGGAGGGAGGGGTR